jgi:hypothetical protein
MGAGCLLAVWLVKDMGVYNTECRMVAAITNKQYFFELSTLPNVIWAISIFPPAAECGC